MPCGDEDFLVRSLRQAEDDLDVREAGAKPGIGGRPGRRAPDLALARARTASAPSTRIVRLGSSPRSRCAWRIMPRHEAAARAEADTHGRAEGVGRARNRASRRRALGAAASRRGSRTTRPAPSAPTRRTLRSRSPVGLRRSMRVRRPRDPRRARSRRARPPVR